ncbi:LacI family DNA-binding transcriptional regulator [Microbacterium karelineae]|uniref:LacI family DNA-binding transcriptional regulator n=1 Tax=Microbacterium karelineae TaxID=2654283 RepID=UPI0018D31316|nr:LacI family DNA-binding transcriptional regulator [Microbacterium karelineae]
MPRPRSSHVTMQDVARHAGVSAQTVSNVVNGRSARVGAPTRDRVIASITALGYRVNQTARSLRRGRTGTIGLGLPTFDSEYYAGLAEELSHRFLERGFRLVVMHTGGAVRTEVDSLASSRLDAYDGFVLALAAGDAEHLAQIDTTTPIVLLGERALSSGLDHVLMDNIGGARRATELLLQRGARDIVALGGTARDEETMPGLRMRGFRDAHDAMGVAPDPSLIVPCTFDQQGGYDGVRGLIAEGREIDAVFAMTDGIAFGAMRALADAGIRVPDDAQVIGFDNVRAGRFSIPRLSTIEPDNAARAESIAELLTSRIDGSEADPARRIVTHPATIVERETTLSAPREQKSPGKNRG